MMSHLWPDESVKALSCTVERDEELDIEGLGCEVACDGGSVLLCRLAS